MTADPIYLDHNATTPIHPEVADAMLPFLREHFGNPSSSHVYGQRAKAAIDRARAQVAALLGAAPDEIVFTSGGTEANNLAIRGVVEGNQRRNLVTTTVEHPATTQPCAYLARHGFDVMRIPVDEQGQVRASDMRAFIRGDTALVTVMLAQNETGTLMPISEIAGLAHAHGALMHTDASQATGKLETRVHDLGVDLLSIAGHKLYAPKGVGALYIRKGITIAPLVLGAGHERGIRPGTENVPHIVGLGQACELAGRDLGTEPARQRALRDELWHRLHEAIPSLRRNTHPTESLPNTLNVSFPGTLGSAVLRCAPEIAASTGSACHEGGETASAVLLAMGLDTTTALGAVRLSLGRSTTRDQVLSTAAALIAAHRKLA